MFRKITIVCIFLSFLSFQETNASAQNKDNVQLTLELMEKSGLNEQIKHIPEALNVLVTNVFKQALRDTNIDPAQVTNQITSIILETYNPKIMRSIISAHIEATLNVKDIEEVLKWLNSPLGKKVTQFEEEASTAEAYIDMIATIPLLKMQNGYKTRLQLIKEIGQCFQATESTVELDLTNKCIIISALSSAFPNINLPSIKAIKANYNKNKQIQKEMTANDIAMSLLYKYRLLELYEIRRYFDFIKTDFGVRYHRAVNEGIGKAYLFCGNKFAERTIDPQFKKSKLQFDKLQLQTYPQRK